MVYYLGMDKNNTSHKKPGRVPGPNHIKTTVLLPPELVEWGKQQNGGLSALMRHLLEDARTKAEKRKQI